MEAKNRTPLGYIELVSGMKAVYPMNDIFLNYTFENEEHWEALRAIVNIAIEAYKRITPDTTARAVTRRIKVRTQYRHLLEPGEKPGP